MTDDGHLCLPGLPVHLLFSTIAEKVCDGYGFHYTRFDFKHLDSDENKLPQVFMVRKLEVVLRSQQSNTSTNSFIEQPAQETTPKNSDRNFPSAQIAPQVCAKRVKVHTRPLFLGESIFWKTKVRLVGNICTYCLQNMMVRICA